MIGSALLLLAAAAMPCESLAHLTFADAADYIGGSCSRRSTSGEGFRWRTSGRRGYRPARGGDRLRRTSRLIAACR